VGLSEPKFIAKKRTKSGMEITIASGNTRHELIEKIKEDSETYKKREREKQNGKEIY
tara:strand:- start:692 stop:862 length:171 start_codon:yes stop_codon:yes gene_type:complete